MFCNRWGSIVVKNLTFHNRNGLWEVTLNTRLLKSGCIIGNIMAAHMASQNWTTIRKPIKIIRKQPCNLKILLTPVSHLPILTHYHISISINTGLSKDARNKIHQRLLASRDMIEASVFDVAKKHALEQLEKPWIRHLKEDLKHFIEYVQYIV